MVRKFPSSASQNPKLEEYRITLDMTFDLPGEVAEQLEMWGINEFDTCSVDQGRCQLKMSAKTTLYRKGV